jgi:rubrerythrin
MEKQWKCTVCGYIHDGSQPPDVCPQCGAFKYQFILYEPLPPNLEKSLREAFAGESKAHVRNRAFADVAEREGFPEVAKLFRAVAEAERLHAAEYLKYLEGVMGDTESNLKTAFENEITANAEIYPPLVKQAFDVKREDVAWRFIRARDVEERHAKLYKQALSALVMGEKRDYHVCQVCGYVFEGDLPEECPACKTNKAQFQLVK